MDSLYSTHVEIAKISENLLTWSKYDYTWLPGVREKLHDME
jgi:hypothetical protein